MPLVDHLMKLRTVEAALQHSATLVAVAAAGVVVGAVTLRWVDGLVGGTSSDARHRLNVAGAAVASAIKPALVLLPFYGVAFAATVASSLAQVVATKMSAEFGALCRESSPLLAARCVRLTTRAAALVAGSSTAAPVPPLARLPARRWQRRRGSGGAEVGHAAAPGHV